MARAEAAIIQGRKDVKRIVAIEDLIRQKTRDIRYSLEGLHAQVRDITGRRKAEDERLKRASTEITKHRAVESERKRALRETEDRILESQQAYDEIERLRQEALNRLSERKEEKEKAAVLWKESQSAIEEAQSEVERVRKSVEKIDAEKDRAEEEKRRQERLLAEALLGSLDVYLLDSFKRIHQAFDGEKERQRKKAAAAGFQKARHEDPKISDLWEQLVQLRDMMTMATVPGVKQRLQVSIADIEHELEQLYPGALNAEVALQEPRLVEDIYYYGHRDGMVSFLLPIPATLWRDIENGDTGMPATRAMRLMWDFQGTDIRRNDGEFGLSREWVAFQSKFGFDDVALLSGFRLELTPDSHLEFRFLPLPGEVQEVIAS